MKILVLGASGMLGQALVKEFNIAGYEVFGWDKTELDITDRERVFKKISALKPRITINAAAYNNVDKAETEDAELAFKINAEAVGYLAEASARVGALFTHYSTDYVFRGDDQNGYAEDAAPDPQSVYAKSKLEGERMILKQGHPELACLPVGKVSGSHEMPKQVRHDFFNYYLIRTSRLFGPAGAGEGTKRSFVDAMLQLGREKSELDLIDEEVGSPTYVVDLARVTRELIESGAPAGIYHRTNNGACTWYEWAREIFKLADLPIKLNPVSASRFLRPAARPKFSKLLNTKLPPLRKWEDALAEYLASIF